MNKVECFSAIGAALSLTVVTAGCNGDPEEESVTEAQQAETIDNGTHLNGIHVNGIHVNGIHVNGLHVNGTTLGGLAVSGMQLEKTSFKGTLSGVARSGLGFIGAEMTGTMSTGAAIRFRFDNIQPSSDPEILLYDVTASLDGQTWAPLCTDLAGQPVHSYPVLGYWDESQGTSTGGDHVAELTEFTFACQGYAIAKCTEMGYKPWAFTRECRDNGDCHSLPLWMHHEACTRMLRADYCGDGTATTRDGTLVDVADAVGLESPTMPNWDFEAEWGFNGAACIKNTRWPTILGVTDPKASRVTSYISAHCPDRWVGAKDKKCGSASSNLYTKVGYSTPLLTRSLLMTRVNVGTP